MLERAREQRAGRRQPLELVSVVAEADDDRAGVDAVERLEQHLHALVLDQLPEVQNGRLLAREERGEAFRIPRIRMPFVAVVRVALRLLHQSRERSLA